MVINQYTDIGFHNSLNPGFYEYNLDLVNDVLSYKQGTYDKAYQNLQQLKADALNINFLNKEKQGQIDQYNKRIQESLSGINQDLSDSNVLNSYMSVFNDLTSNTGLIQSFKHDRQIQQRRAEILEKSKKADPKKAGWHSINYQNYQHRLNDYINSTGDITNTTPYYNDYVDYNDGLVKLIDQVPEEEWFEDVRDGNGTIVRTKFKGRNPNKVSQLVDNYLSSEALTQLKEEAEYAYNNTEDKAGLLSNAKSYYSTSLNSTISQLELKKSKLVLEDHEKGTTEPNSNIAIINERIQQAKSNLANIDNLNSKGAIVDFLGRNHIQETSGTFTNTYSGYRQSTEIKTDDVHFKTQDLILKHNKYNLDVLEFQEGQRRFKINTGLKLEELSIKKTAAQAKAENDAIKAKAKKLAGGQGVSLNPFDADSGFITQENPKTKTIDQGINQVIGITDALDVSEIDVTKVNTSKALGQGIAANAKIEQDLKDSETSTGFFGRIATAIDLLLPNETADDYASLLAPGVMNSIGRGFINDIQEEGVREAVGNIGRKFLPTAFDYNEELGRRNDLRQQVKNLNQKTHTPIQKLDAIIQDPTVFDGSPLSANPGIEGIKEAVELFHIAKGKYPQTPQEKQEVLGAVEDLKKDGTSRTFQAVAEQRILKNNLRDLQTEIAPIYSNESLSAKEKQDALFKKFKKMSNNGSLPIPKVKARRLQINSDLSNKASDADIQYLYNILPEYLVGNPDPDSGLLDIRQHIDLADIAYATETSDGRLAITFKSNVFSDEGSKAKNLAGLPVMDSDGNKHVITPNQDLVLSNSSRFNNQLIANLVQRIPSIKSQYYHNIEGTNTVTNYEAMSTANSFVAEVPRSPSLTDEMLQNSGNTQFSIEPIANNKIRIKAPKSVMSDQRFTQAVKEFINTYYVNP